MPLCNANVQGPRSDVQVPTSQIMLHKLHEITERHAFLNWKTTLIQARAHPLRCSPIASLRFKSQSLQWEVEHWTSL